MAGSNGSNLENEKVMELDALIVGAGFGGCYLLHLLQKQGLNVKLFDAGASLGGTWEFSRYPGARVDSEVPYYAYSDPALWSTWTWTERYPGHAELREYFKHVDKIWQLSKDVKFKTRVVEAKYGDKHLWHIKTATGQSCTCKYFLSCAGTSFKQYIPTWEGLDQFKGPMYHSSLWPSEGVDYKGKRVAVIGASASGIQLVQEMAGEAESLTQFIRTPCITIPMHQRKLSREECLAYRHTIPHLLKAARQSRVGLPYEPKQFSTMDDTPDEREKVWEEHYGDYLVNKEANAALYEFWKKKTRARMKDPGKRDLLAPEEAPYCFGTKRASLEQDYYEQVDKTHVTITISPIIAFNEKGVVTKKKVHAFDVIAIATGYDAVTGGLETMGIRGSKGIKLAEKWADGISTHLGMMVNGFPNMFIVYGPQAPTSLTNGPIFLELQCEFIRDLICKMRDTNISTVEAKKEAEEAWRERVKSIADRTLTTNTNSWWNGANIPGKRKEMMIYMGGLPDYFSCCEEAIDGWRDYDITK